MVEADRDLLDTCREAKGRITKPTTRLEVEGTDSKRVHQDPHLRSKGARRGVMDRDTTSLSANKGR